MANNGHFKAKNGLFGSNYITDVYKSCGVSKLKDLMVPICLSYCQPYLRSVVANNGHFKAQNWPIWIQIQKGHK